MPSSFYSTHSPYSDPRSHCAILRGISADPLSLAHWIGSILQHPRAPESREYGFTLDQAADLELRSVADILSVAIERDVLAGHSAKNKIGGLCRDFAILAVSRFRSEGIPARLRVGFANYLVSHAWEDHWLCEWHDGRYWRRLDVEFAAIDGLPFDALDVSRDRFITAGEAWIRIKPQPETAGDFGVASLDLNGAWFIAGSLFRDIAALHRLELKPWDYWGLAEDLPRDSSLWPEQVWATLDHLAARLTETDVEHVSLPDAVADWPLPERILSFPQGKALPVLVHRSCV